MRAEEFVSHLVKVRRTGPGRWVSCCPAHEDKHPSFTIRELEDGRILTHCFAGCSVEEVVSAIGVSVSDLFPEKLTDYGRPMRRPFPAEDVLACLQLEAQIVAICAGDMAAGRELSKEDKVRLTVAQERIQEAVRLANG